jgi:8-oxo-dGTP pyrophosphatase MutT (NUDIX family)
MIPFTLRLSTLAHHAGEICFPGGGFEEHDPSISFTALRETSEELGIDPQKIQVIGPITPIYISASNNIVHPIVGWTDARPSFVPSPDEVEKIIEVPLSALLDPLNRIDCQRTSRGKERTVPCYRIQEEFIWGATAMILSELLLILSNRILTTNG